MYLLVNLLRPGPSSCKKIIYQAAVSQRMRNNGLDGASYFTYIVTNTTGWTLNLLI
jgi:hypothetical protein